MARSTEPTPSTRAQRQSGTGRLLAIDAARGLAMVGMVIVNVGPTRTEGVLGRLYLAPYGRASILFVLIAGLGMSFFRRSRRDDARRWPVLLPFAIAFLVVSLNEARLAGGWAAAAGWCRPRHRAGWCRRRRAGYRPPRSR